MEALFPAQVAGAFGIGDDSNIDFISLCLSLINSIEYKYIACRLILITEN